MTEFSAPKGVPDYLPPDSAQFVAVRDGLLAAARRAGYGDVELPIFEDTALFARGVGESTDVVSKEMYTFADRGDRSVTLRPEGTAGVVRAVIEHGLDRGALPVKLCYAGPFFRYERPQKGRYRQSHQFGVECFGYEGPEADLEVISLAGELIRGSGIEDAVLNLNSIGDQECRPRYRQALVEHFRPRLAVAAKLVPQHVREDLPEPACKLRLGLSAELRQGAHRLHHRLLHDVGRVELPAIPRIDLESSQETEPAPMA